MTDKLKQYLEELELEYGYIPGCNSDREFDLNKLSKEEVVQLVESELSTFTYFNTLNESAELKRIINDIQSI